MVYISGGKIEKHKKINLFEYININMSMSQSIIKFDLFVKEE